MAVHIFGIRHHGPGSARHLTKALYEIKPDIILVEGPPEGESILEWVTHADMKPPVALLAYVPENPKQAIFYPFTSFSPEWNAIEYGLLHKIPARFIDMPLIHKMASPEDTPLSTPPPEQKEEADATLIPQPDDAPPSVVAMHPIAYLAAADGFEDAEEWWEHQFELSDHPVEVFEAVSEAMGALREQFPTNDKEEEIREAFMRRAIRQAEKKNYQTIAVVCGAWHGPALKNMPPAKQDDPLLKNLPKVKIETTWIPWTNDRLSFESGYGAGVFSPGWYEHLWENPKDKGAHWLSKTAHIFRQKNVDISSAHIIEAVRLVESLAALRGFSKPGLKEMFEATQTVMCMGDGILMQIIHKELIVGNKMGDTPQGVPQVPLQKDFEATLKKLRLKLSNDVSEAKLDLREANDLARSTLFHRLQVLEIHWASTRYTRSNSKGTFKEEWSLKWSPEHTLQLLEKAPWGNTIEEAANAYLKHEAYRIQDLALLTELVQKALPAELHEGIKQAMRKMDELAATTSDTPLLMDAFLPMVQVSRYGNVRNLDLKTIEVILDSIFYRIIVSLPVSCVGINPQQATELAKKIEQMNQAVILLENPEYKEKWIETIAKITESHQTAGRVHGKCCKLLYDIGHFDQQSLVVLFNRALSISNDPAYSAGWIEGFLKEAATILIMDDVVWSVVLTWVASLPEEVFLEIIPLLRRTFAEYSSVEKTKIAERVNQKPKAATVHLQTEGIDEQRGLKVIPILEKLMGLS